MKERREALEAMSRSRGFRIGLLLLAAVFLVLDVFQTSVVSARGNEISDLQQRVRTLTQENERLDFEIAQHRSMASVQERLAAMNLVDSGTPQYVRLAGSAVAVK